MFVSFHSVFSLPQELEDLDEESLVFIGPDESENVRVVEVGEDFDLLSRPQFLHGSFAVEKFDGNIFILAN